MLDRISFLSEGLLNEKLLKALMFRNLDAYLFKNDINYANQMTILRNALTLGVLPIKNVLEMKVQAMVDAYARVTLLSEKTAEKNLWAEWKEFRKLRDEIDEILSKRERKWKELELKVAFGKTKKK